MQQQSCQSFDPQALVERLICKPTWLNILLESARTWPLPKRNIDYFCRSEWLFGGLKIYQPSKRFCPWGISTHTRGEWVYVALVIAHVLFCSDFSLDFWGSTQVPAGFIPYGRDGKPESVGRSGAAAKVMAQCPKKTAPVRGQLTKTLDWLKVWIRKGQGPKGVTLAEKSTKRTPPKSCGKGFLDLLGPCVGNMLHRVRNT